MSARSSRPDRRGRPGRGARVALAGAAIAACGGGAPEADPAEVRARARQMLASAPAPAAVRACRGADLRAPSLTQRTLLELAGEPVSEAPERAAWINPPALDTPPARVLLDAGAAAADRRRAAAQLLAAPALLVLRPDMVNVPLALGVKELKRGAVGMRAIGYDRAGQATCATVFTVRNDAALAEQAMDQADEAVVPPAVIEALRADLTRQLITAAQQLVATTPD